MKASDITGLLRLLLYDAVGLLLPGLVFLFALVQYATNAGAFSELRTNLVFSDWHHTAVVLLTAYLLGYLLQSLAYWHFQVFAKFGKRLFRKSPEESPNQGSVSAVGRFTASYFEKTEFYGVASKRIAEFLRIDPSLALTFSDFQNLAFSIAGDEAETARNFRFRSDLCSAVATLLMLNSLAFVPVWLLTQPGGHWTWWSVPLAIIGLTLLFQHLPSNSSATLAGWLMPVGVAALTILLRFLTGTAPHMYLTVPLLLVAWFLFVSRAFFYGDIGGRIIFHIAVAACARETSDPEKQPSP